MSQSTNFGDVATSGVQDVSAILPLLGTEQCERHIACAMERGFLYAAGTPMSVFGSLGIVKAGFAALWVSLEGGKFHGPRQLRNAGFYPTGIIEKLTYEFDTNESIYVAENRIRNILHQFNPSDVAVNLFSWAWLRWNLAMALFTALFGPLGFIPYIYIITHDIADRSFIASWMYPMLRVTGCSLTAVMVQIVVQLRILCIIHSRVRFMAISQFLQEQGRLAPGFWNSDARSEECLSLLKADLKKSWWKPLPDYLQGISDDIELTDIGSFVSFSKAPQYRRYNKINSFLFHAAQLLSRFLLIVGMVGSVIGYVGCFSIVQRSKNSRGPLIWLGTEVALCILRLIIWASNPDWDDPPAPVALRKVRSKEIKGTDGTEGGDTSVTYDVSWALDGVTADDMHAVIIGIDKISNQSHIQSLAGAVEDAEAVAAYLTDDLAVPQRQIKLLTNKNAKASSIKDALRDLATNSSIRTGAPILVFFACHSYAELSPNPDSNSNSSQQPAKTSFSLVPEDYDEQDVNTKLSYAMILDHVKEIATSKGENITLILDTCHAAGLGINDKFDLPKSDILIGYPTHVLLAACSETQVAVETEKGGLFTRALLKQLIKDDDKNKSMTYRGLIEKIREDPGFNQFAFRDGSQIPQCSGTFQNRLLFNGLLSKKHIHSSNLQSSSVIFISTHTQSTNEGA